MMLVYIVMVENGEWPDERDKEIHWAGIDLLEALKALETARADYRIHFEVWQNDKCLSSYMRDAWQDKAEATQKLGKWEHNGGTAFPPIESLKG